jgi:hypothetical protein
MSFLSRIGPGLALVFGLRPVAEAADEESAALTPKVWSPWLALSASVALLAAALAANASRSGSEWAVPAFYLSIGFLYLPAAVRLILPNGPSSDRLATVILVGLALFGLRLIRAPLFFVDHDEYLHLETAKNILKYHELFSPNTLFPIGPYYPGLEIIAAALAELAGISIFAASELTIGLVRLAFIGCLYCAFSRITGSTRTAALASILYMGCSTFVFFDSQFAYESLALAFLALALLLDVLSESGGRGWPLLATLYCLVVTSLAVTHHMTAFLLAGLFCSLFVLQTINDRRPSLRAFFVAAIALAVPVGWSQAMGNPGSGYLGPLLENGLRDLIQLLTFGPGRKLFTSDDGLLAPLWQRSTTLAAVAIVCLGLALGFFRSLSWAGMPLAKGEGLRLRSLISWRNNRLVLLTLLTFLYPVSVVFRLTRNGWEIGNRIGPFAFLGVAVVLAIFVVTCLQARSTSLVRAIAVAVLATVIVAGGIISAEGPRVLVPAKFQVSADAASIEPMGIEAARWTKEWLGVGNHFTSDRINGLLLSGFGDQLISTTLQHGDDAGVALMAENFSQNELNLLVNIGIDFLMADLRLTTGLPQVGSYFDGSVADQMLAGPPQPTAFLKFDTLKSVGRPFDNGYSIIYDVRVLSGRR